MLGLLSKRYHNAFGVRVRYSIDVNAVVEGEGVCTDDGPWLARRSLQTIAMDVRCHC